MKVEIKKIKNEIRWYFMLVFKKEHEKEIDEILEIKDTTKANIRLEKIVKDENITDYERGVVDGLNMLWSGLTRK